MLVVVGVPTCRRTELLRRCLDSIRAQVDLGLTRVEVLVVDNDPAAGAAQIAEAAGVTYLQEIRPGVVAVRNRILEHAQDRAADWVAMIDDDEVAEPGWLVSLLDAATSTGADLVTGVVLPDFGESDVSPVLRSYYDHLHCPDLSPTTDLRCGSVAMSAAVFAGSNPLRFDDRFALSGGEDSDFAVRADAAGFLMVYAARAVAVESVPPERVGWRWVLQRYLGYGEKWARLRILHERVSRPRLFFGGVARVILGLFRAGTGVLAGRSPLHRRAVAPVLWGLGAVLVSLGVETQDHRYGETR